MKQGDVALTPQVAFLGTHAAIEAYPSPTIGMEAIATDAPIEKGYYDGSAWVWGGSGGITAKEAFEFALANYVDEITNGSFTENADGWTLGAGWAWNVGGYVEHTTTDTEPMSQTCGGAIQNATYLLYITVSGTTGGVTVGLDEEPSLEIAAGTVGSYLIKSNGSTLYIIPSSDFNGYVTSISMFRQSVMQDAIQDNAIYGRKNGSWVSVKPYKSYVAMLNQSGSGDPTATELENELGSAVTFVRDDAGQYSATNAAFIAASTIVLVGTSISGGYNHVAASIVSDGTLTIWTFGETGDYGDDLLLNTALELHIYP